MSANSAAFDHVNGFRWRQGDPSLAESEAAQVQYDGSRYCVSPVLVGLFSCLATATTPAADSAEGLRESAAPK